MARLFDNSNGAYLKQTSTQVTTYPYSMAAWFYPNNVSVGGYLLCIGDEDTDYHTAGLGFSGNVSGDPVTALSRDSVTSPSYAASTNGATGVANTWYHAAAVFANATSRAAFFNGGAKGTNSVGRTPSDIDSLCIGAVARASLGAFFSGGIAEAAIWNAALTDAEVAMLGAGLCPLMVRLDALVAYWPLGGIYDTDEGDHDVISGTALSAYGSPTIADHPGGIVYPTTPIVGPLASMTAIRPWYYHQRNRMRRAV